MPRFLFEATDSSGTPIREVIEAASHTEAHSMIRAKGYYPTKISAYRSHGNGSQNSAFTPRLGRGLHIAMVGVIAALCGWFLAQLGDYPLSLLPLMAGFFLVIVLLKSDIGVFAFVAIILAYPILSSRSSGPDRVDLLDLFFVVSLVGFVGCSFRFLDMWRLVHLKPDQTQLRPYAGRWYYLAIAVLSSLFVFWVFQMDPSSQYRYGLQPHVARTISIAWFTVFAWLVVTACFSLVLWRRLDSRQAEVYVRSTLAGELDPELTAIERRRARSKNKSS